MNSVLISLVSVVVILGFMILIHEFGHYAVAKLLGVRVEQFAIGFGKRLVGFTKGETDYRINAIPLGGYVKMSGENPMDERTGDPREFLSHSRWHRFLIAIAGPVMNIALAVVLLTIVYKVHYEHPAFLYKPAVVGGVEPDSPAAKAGIQPGDRIVQLDGIHNPTWEQTGIRTMLSPNQSLDFTVERDGKTIRGTIMPVPASSERMGLAGWMPQEPVIVDELVPKMPAAKAGLRKGDRILASDGKPLPSIGVLLEGLQQTKEKPVRLTVLRGDQTFDVTVGAVLSDMPDSTEKYYRIGFSAREEMTVSKLNWRDAFDQSLTTNKKYSVVLLELVGKLVQRKVSLRAVSGPIGIAQQAGRAAEEGWDPFLELTAGISLNLGIFNLLPIPIMDGGVILLLFIESLMRRDISLPIKERIYQAAFVFLVLFAAMVIYNDIVKTLGQRLP